MCGVARGGVMADKAAGHIVVVTGASGGIGRATAIAFCRRGATVSLISRGEEGLLGASREVESAGGRPGRERAGSDRRLGECGIHLGVRPIRRDRADGVQACHRSHLSGIRVRDNDGAETDETPGSRHDRASRLRSGLSRHPPAQPVPPTFQPEVAADAVLYAADHPRRREYWVGGSTMKVLIANASVPGILDHYLARTGYSSQQRPQRRDQGQPEDLWEPADSGKDFGTHGDFDAVAIPRSTLGAWVGRKLRS